MLVAAGMCAALRHGPSVGSKLRLIRLLLDLSFSCEDGVRNNLRRNPTAKAMFAFSVCLCMSCALSEEGGAGLGTLGFSKAVANEMLGAGGFGRVRVLLEHTDRVTGLVCWGHVLASVSWAGLVHGVCVECAGR